MASNITIVEPKQQPPVPEDEKKKMLSNATYHLGNIEPFYGNLLQEIVIKYNEFVPTAGITYNVKNTQYECYINPRHFIKLTNLNRTAVLQHEILHFTNKHLFRFPFLKDQTTEEDRRLYNIAGDLAINQFIQNLPDGCKLCRGKKMSSPEEWQAAHPTEEDQEACVGKCLDIKDWLCDDGTPFPALLSMEEYYDLIKKEKEKQTGKDGKPKPDPTSKEGKGKGPGETTKGTVAKNLAGGAKSMDQHEWDALDEETKKKMLDEAKKLIKRSIEKTSNSYTKIPDSIKDLLDEIDVLATGLDEKSILKSVIKKTVACADREGTWKKPNKRYGNVSPGTRIGNLPQCSFYVDTSGSISVIELNEFLYIMSRFLKAGSRTCWLGLWHTSLYYKKKYKLNTEINKSDVKSGGTMVTAALEDIKKTKPNLAIVLTDGYYEQSDIKITTDVVFIISKNGNKNHPMKHLGKTILMENIK